MRTFLQAVLVLALGVGAAHAQGTPKRFFDENPASAVGPTDVIPIEHPSSSDCGTSPATRGYCSEYVTGAGIAAGLAGTAAGTLAAGNDSRIVGAVQSSTLGQPNGPAQLGSGGALPIGQIPVGKTASTVAAGTIGAGIVNALDKGLACDGVTDNATAIAALNAASGAGVTIYFPPAAQPCLTSAFFSPASGTTVYAYPGTVTLKPTSASTASVVLFAVANESNVYVHGLTFDGGGANFGTANNVVQVYNGSNIIFDGDTFQHTRGLALLFSQSNYSGVRNSVFNDNGNHWITTLVTGDRVDAVSFCCGTEASNVGDFANDNWFTNVGLDAISDVLTTGFVAARNHCYLANNQVSLLSASAYGACVYVSTADQTKILSNEATGVSGNSFDLYASTNMTVQGNAAVGGGQAGIGLFGITGASVTGNILNGNGHWSSSVYKGGITVSGPLAHAVISANISTDTQGTQTQSYGLHVVIGTTTLSSVWVDPSNDFSGNLTSAFGGGLLTGYGAGGLPTASAGTVNAGSSSTRGSVTLASSLTSTTITFAQTLPSAPYCQLTSSVAGDVPAVTSISATALTIGLSANSAGATVAWQCPQ